MSVTKADLLKVAGMWPRNMEHTEHWMKDGEPQVRLMYYGSHDDIVWRELLALLDDGVEYTEPDLVFHPVIMKKMRREFVQAAYLVAVIAKGAATQSEIRRVIEEEWPRGRRTRPHWDGKGCL